MAVEDSVLEWLDKSEEERLQRIAKAWEAFSGDHPDSLVVRDEGDPDDNTPVNFSRTVVRKGVTFLMGKNEGPKIEVRGADRDKETGEASNDPAKLEDFIARSIGRSGPLGKSGGLLLDYATNGGVTGHAFLKIVLPNEDKGEELPRLRTIDPSYVNVAYEEDDYEDVWRYRITFGTLDREGRPVLIRQEIEKVDSRDTDEGIAWVIRDQRAAAPPSLRMDDYLSVVKTWRTQQFETERVEEWRYAFPPIVENQNLRNANEYWGMSDLEADVIDLNYALNDVVSNMRRIVRIYAHPRPWVSGVSSADIVDASADEMIRLPHADANMGILESKANLAASLDLYKLLREAFHEVTETPEVTTGKVEGLGPLAGVALQILYGPLLDRTEEKQGTYGAALRETGRRLGIIGEFEGKDVDLGVDAPDLFVVKWPEDLVPSDPLSEAAAAEAKKRLGVSTDTLLEEQGYDPDLERANREADAEEAQKNFERGGGIPPVPPGGGGSSGEE